ncbi:DUF1345 domain-containing protein [Deinococcus irradiatisoli]|uniref:DUF1345 domain-containing protein n=1 Tax=Deinococcus irradiatisoli TaxID=2202254 RepID=A0A2Z3JNK6_9DEIO|nr:DUF1345 domain-containing protein [Deinococcus irradiatisoli]AWN22774.1 DUF1345 domain-containing protein [Deinococcus irradiatisoli]
MTAPTRSHQHVLAPMRLLISLGFGLAAWLLTWLLPYDLPWPLRALTGWMVLAASYLISAWRLIHSVDGEWIRDLARQEDNGRHASGVIAMFASGISLAGVMFALAEANTLKHQLLLETLLIVSGLGSVALSWLLIQTIYIFRYAHVYYEEPEGGAKFEGSDEPDYHDFAYLSFAVGMTYGITDSDLSKPALRRLVTRHALIAYVYGVVIVALAISVVSAVLS